MQPTTSTILIVDDQFSAREVLRGLLSGHHYQLEFAANGPEALEKAEAVKPDVILLDVMMPEMDGFEVCAQIRKQPQLAEVPIIMLTALDDLSSRIKGIESGADDFITKPFNTTELLARLRTITRLNRYRRLLTERARFEWVVEQAQDGYLVLDNQDQIIYANSKALAYLGFSGDSPNYQNSSFIDRLKPRYRFEPAQAWANWPAEPAQHQRPARYLVRPETATTQTIWLQVDLLQLPDVPEGQFMVHLHDVTTQMELQRDMWEFQALVSHKLRTPLASVVTGMELLKDHQITDSLSSEMQDLFNLVSRNVHRLNRDIQNILQFLYTPTLAQPGTGCAVSELQPIITKISNLLKLKHVNISSGNIRDDSPALALSELAIELILTEILENAIKFHPQQTPAVEVAITQQAEYLLLKISDDGAELSAEQIHQLWLPYYQNDKYFTGEVAGMGLGLSRVALLIWGVGGTSRIYNREPGPGITVELSLPLLKTG